MASAFENLSPKVIADLVRDLGLTPEQAAGICGNAKEESGFLAINEKKPIVPGSRGGYGWFQLTGDRRVAFEKWANSRKLPLDSYEAQYGYLIKELMTSEKKALEHLRECTTPKAAAETFGYYFERFDGYKKIKGNKNYERRAKAAEDALDLYYASLPPPVEEKITLESLQKQIDELVARVARLEAKDE